MKKISKSMISQYRRYLKDCEKSKSTIAKYIRDINNFAEWLNGREITKELTVAYKEHIMKLYATSSVNSMLSSVNGFFDYYEMYDKKVKTIKMQKSVFVDSASVLTKADYEKLLIAAKTMGKTRLYMIMQTICVLGIRVSELEYITVAAVASGRAVIDCKGKRRVAIIPAGMCKVLADYTKSIGVESGPVFVTNSGKAVDRSNIWREMRNLCTVAGVSSNKVFPHNLRHLFARTYYSVQKDIVRLADILGHSNINTTRIYTADSSDTHMRTMEKTGLMIV